MALGHLIRMLVKITKHFDFFDFSYMGDARIWIGGNGSFCPFLLPLPPLIQHKCFLLHGMFECGDGIMIFFPDNNDHENLHLARALSALGAGNSVEGIN